MMHSPHDMAHFFAADTHISDTLAHDGVEMEHFAVVQSMCRIGLADGNPKFRQQVERLRERLQKAGGDKEAAVLSRLLAASSKSASLAPSRVELSRAVVAGEELTPTIHPPADRETGAFLADVILAPTPGTRPVFPADLERAIESIASEWKNHDSLKKLGVAPARSCLLFGSPGTGKTLTALDFARRLQLPVVSARIDGLISSFLGTTARNIANLFEFANRYRCVLLLDEFDAIAKLRDDPQEVGEIKRVVNTLLQNLDQRAEFGVTIAITNHPNLLDPAIWRRFEVRIEMPLPGVQERESLIKEFSKEVDLGEPHLNFIGWLTDGSTGAEIKALTNALKRFIALAPEGATSANILEALTTYARTSSTPSPHDKLRLLVEPKKLARTLFKGNRKMFTQPVLAIIFDKDQGTISRWVNEDD